MTYGAISDALIRLLRKRDLVTREELRDAVYGNAPDAPDDERKALNRTISNLRRLHGVQIECVVCFRLKP